MEIVTINLMEEVGSRKAQNYPDLRTSEIEHTTKSLRQNGENKSIIIAGITLIFPNCPETGEAEWKQ